jgi:hypothetical protein
LLGGDFVVCADIFISLRPSPAAHNGAIEKNIFGDYLAILKIRDAPDIRLAEYPVG